MTASDAGPFRPDRRPGRFDHQAAWERFGEADAWEGSVNDPRTREEHGVRYNEKWVYQLPGGSRRIVYWHRYELRGIRIVGPDGSVREERV